MRTSWGNLRRAGGWKCAELAAPSWPFLELSDEDLYLAGTSAHSFAPALHGGGTPRDLGLKKYKILQEPISQCR